MNPFEGWLARYKVNRPISEHERLARLDVESRIDLPPVDRGVIRLNDAFIEYVDRHFFLRGWALMGGMPLFLFGVIFGGLFVHSSFSPMNDGTSHDLFGVIFGLTAALIFFGCGVIALKFCLLKDAFSLTYFPIRFDRRNRQVHAIIRTKWGKRREISLPWDQALFYIAPVGPAKPTSGEVVAPQLHCHVLDADGVTIRDTFAIGNSCANEAMALQHWEMIRRFMEEGVDALPYPPLEIYMNTETTLRNAMLLHVAGSGDGLLRIFAMIFTVPWAIFRYLALKTCQSPKWSRAVEEATRVERGDPSVRRQPAYMGQFQTQSNAALERAMQYDKEARQAASDYMARNSGKASAEK